jgi:uncharacterized protein YkwD
MWERALPRLVEPQIRRRPPLAGGCPGCPGATSKKSMKTKRFQIAIGTLFLALTVPSPAASLAAGPLPARASNAACSTADKPTLDIKRFQKAVSCLHNLERRHHGLRNLRWNIDLSLVAGKHARDMVRRHYFEHLSPDHRNNMDRTAASGYRPTAGCWSAGENLFFSRGASTPRQLLRAWMNSQAHRKNILRGRWHDFGLGVVKTSPSGERGGMTVVALFGTRSRHACN